MIKQLLNSLSRKVIMAADIALYVSYGYIISNRELKPHNG